MIQPDWADPGIARSYLADVILGDFEDADALRAFVSRVDDELSDRLRVFLLAVADDEAAAAAAIAPPPPVSADAQAKLAADVARLIATRNDRLQKPAPPPIPLVMGAIWTPSPVEYGGPTPSPNAFLVLATPDEEEDLVQVAPVVFCEALAGADDFVLEDRTHHIAGFAAMGLEHPVPKSLLEKGIGYLEEDEREALAQWRYASFGVEHDARVIELASGTAPEGAAEVVGLYREYVEICDGFYREDALLLMAEESDDENASPESNVIDLRALWAEHHRRNQSKPEIAAWPVETERLAGSGDTERRAGTVITVECVAPPARFALYPGESGVHWRLELVEGNESAFEDAILRGTDGVELGRMRQGIATFHIHADALFLFYLANGDTAWLRIAGF